MGSCCRAVTLGLAGAVLGLYVSDHGASAAARRPLPPPPEERWDPNLSGVQGKVLASKNWKEAMKEAVGNWIVMEREREACGRTNWI